MTKFITSCKAMLKLLQEKGGFIRYFRFVSYFGVSLISFSLIMPVNAYAYIDPGTGSFIIQVLIGVLAGALVALKIFCVKVRGFFKGKLSKGKNLE